MILTLLMAIACSNGQDTSDPLCYHEPQLSYENFGKGYMDKHCVGCHSVLLPVHSREGAPVGVDLNTYQDVMFWLERIDARSTGESPTMPPGGGPSVDERALLEEWLNCQVTDDLEANQ
jgi:uncharacterized membrane protein